MKDVISAGLESLFDGTKNQVSEFNDNFQRLQTRWGMPPVMPDAGPTTSGCAESDATMQASLPTPNSSSAPVHAENLPQFSSLATEDPLQVQDHESDRTQELGKETNDFEPEDMLTVLTGADVDLEMDQVVQEDDGSDESASDSEYESDAQD